MATATGELTGPINRWEPARVTGRCELQLDGYESLALSC